MKEHTLSILEFDKVLARLARHTSFSAGRSLALSLRPTSDHEEVVRRQRITAEARRLRQMQPGVGLGGVSDVRPQAHKAAIAGVLEPTEFLDVASTLHAAGSLRGAITRLDRSGAGRSGLPLLVEIAGGIADLSDLVSDIEGCINQRAEVTDDASPMLAILRRDVRVAHDRLNAKLQAFLNSQQGRQVVQEPIVTLRDGRYVIPVKADFRGQIEGIVHDVSSSGATVFLEPLSIVELGNTWRELQLEEQREVERVLRRLSAAVGHAVDEIDACVAALAEIDLALAKARLAEELDAYELPYEGESQGWLVAADAEASLNLVNARHPLLKGEVVPISMAVGGKYSVLLITGPNTGGKTVALKTVGLLSLMAQAGLPVPADAGSRMPIFTSVNADIGDEQSIEQSLSTFSSHMTNIIAVIGEAQPESLVLLDELGAGTDPTEGSALARSILEKLLGVGCLTVATTHHGELKAFAHATSGVMNACVEFDPETLAPTYRLTIGLPGRSNALAIAERLGLPADVVEKARESLPEEQLAVESLLAEIQAERQQATATRRAEELARQETEDIRARLEEKLDALDDEREQVLASTRAEMEEELAATKDLLAQAAKRIEKKKIQPAAEKVAAAEARITKVKQPPPRRRRKKEPPGIPPEQIQVGDLVWLRGLGRFGEALGPPDERNEVELRLGALHSRVPLGEVEKVTRPHERKGPAALTPELPPPPMPDYEIDIRGMTGDEALPILDKYLDDAYRAGLSPVRIVHGKGTGALRRAVREMLAAHPLVRSTETAPREEGGEGVTVVSLAG